LTTVTSHGKVPVPELEPVRSGTGLKSGYFNWNRRNSKSISRTGTGSRESLGLPYH